MEYLLRAFVVDDLIADSLALARIPGCHRHMLAVPIAVFIQTLLDEFYTFDEGQPAAHPVFVDTARTTPRQPGTSTASDD